MLTQETMLKGLDWAYSTGVEGVPGTMSVMDLADSYGRKKGSLSQQIDSLIRYQTFKCGASGFMTGVGGFITLPVAIPLTLSSVLYVQLRMIAGVAYLCGHDIRGDRVKTVCYTCLCGNAVADVFKEVGIKIGTKITTNAIKNISGQTLIRINQKVGFRLLTKFGTTGTINLSRYVPLAGGVIGGGWDAFATYSIGKIAKQLFMPIGDGVTKSGKATDATRPKQLKESQIENESLHNEGEAQTKATGDKDGNLD